MREGRASNRRHGKVLRHKDTLWMGIMAGSIVVQSSQQQRPKAGDHSPFSMP